MKLLTRTAAVLSGIAAVLALSAANSAAADVTRSPIQQTAAAAPLAQDSLNWD
ncbi:hypothetical protein ACFC1R_18570 [Kitasatospora sp. NPDC056138]|uniref:hypothetical protein n=1 Tax=Kitasatospora sp. NPDC056138 TaxID=3345724 RepID=UPI0035DE3D29